MYYIESPSTDACFNLALEEYVFESLPRAESYFMLWQNRDTVVVGKYQNTAEEINADYVRERDIAVVRRLSGGGAVYHDLGNLNFTFIVDQGGGAGPDFQSFVDPVLRALAQIGVKAERSGRNDICIEGKKISGNAQYSKNGRTMHHGTLLFNSDLSVLGEVLRVRADKIQSKGVKSVRSRVTNIQEHLERPVDLPEFQSLLLRHLFAENDLEVYPLTETDLERTEILCAEKYGTWAWNYGRSPAYTARRERRFEFGSVTALLSVTEGRIQMLSFYGDFFGNGDLEELSAALTGCELREPALLAALEGIDVGHYIHGMDAALLCALLC